MQVVCLLNVEEAAANSPGVFIKPAARKQPVQDPGCRIRGPPGYRPVNGRAPRYYFTAIFVNKYTGYLTVSTGAVRLPFGTPRTPEGSRVTY